MINISLISIHIKKSPLSMPLAAGILKTSLSLNREIKGDTDISIIDHYITDDFTQIAENIISKKTDIAGFSLYIWNTEIVMKAAALLKKINPDIIIVIGGAEASSRPDFYCDNKDMDYVVTGEGEEIFCELIISILHKKPLSEKKLKSGNSTDLDKAVSPFLSGNLDLKRYSGVIWELTRGCPYKCDFCFESYEKDGIRSISQDRIEKELELFEKEKINQVFVLDPTFNHNRERTMKILKMISKKAPGIHFTFEIKAELLDKETARLFGETHCGLQIGLQSSSSNILSKINRKFDPALFKNKISMLNKYNVIFGFDLIYGLPYDNYDNFKESIDYAIDLQPNHIDVFPLSIFSGTKLSDNAVRAGIICSTKPPYNIISSSSYPEDQIKKSEILKNAIDLFYNKGTAVSWFFLIIKSLKLLPSEILEEFGKALVLHGKDDYSYDRIIEFQIDFIKKLCKANNKERYFNVIKNIILYYSFLSKSLYIGYEYTNDDNDIKNKKISLCRGTYLFYLDYDIDDLLKIGTLTLEAFLKQVKKKKTNAVVYNNNGIVLTLMLDNKWFDVMHAIKKNKMSLSDLSNEYPAINSNELKDFMNFMASENILYFRI